MNSLTIETILKERGAWLKATHGEPEVAAANAPLSRLIADNYALFETVRDAIFRATEDYVHRVPIVPHALDSSGLALLEQMEKHAMVIREPSGQNWRGLRRWKRVQMKRFLAKSSDGRSKSLPAKTKLI
jgi:hypothetical protein